MTKNESRVRRGLKTKAIIRHSNRPRLVVHRSSNHIYAQIIMRSENGDLVLTSASTLDKEFKVNKDGNKCEQAVLVGKLLATRAKEKGLSQVAFDRAGYKFHGRVKALAEGAREGGLDF